MVDEPMSNGGWNAALGVIFASPEYIIAPEKRERNMRLDLGIYSVQRRRVVVAFEGKNSTFSWVNLAGEVLQSCRAILLSGGRAYGVGGRGSECLIMQYDGSQSQYGFIRQDGTVGWNNTRRTHHIINDEAAIQAILEDVRDNLIQ